MLKIVIADDNKQTCEFIMHNLHTVGLKVEVVGIAYSGDKLFTLIQEITPDIVITDIKMPEMSGLEVMKNTKLLGINCHFILMSEHKNFDFAYTSIKYGVSDFLIKPFNNNELNESISKISWIIRHQTKLATPLIGDPARHHFVLKGIEEINYAPITLAEVNDTYNMKLQKGYFQFFLLRIEHELKPKEAEEHISLLHLKLINLIQRHLEPLCIDIAVIKDLDDFTAVINYQRNNKALINKALEDILEKAKFRLSKSDLTATLTVGHPYEDFTKLYNSKMEATSAAWARMTYGIEKVIYFDNIKFEDIPKSEFDVLKMEKRLRSSFESLNIEEFKKCIFEIYSLPEVALYNLKIKTFIKNIPLIFVTMHKDNISNIDDYENVLKNLRYILRVENSYSKSKDSIINSFSEQMLNIKKYIDSQKTTYVKKAMIFVKENYEKNISLDEIANYVGLSTVYFSTIFKKDTGQNFSEYLNNFRMNSAKKLLSETSLKINEVAVSVGYTDSRYFSRIFKKNSGVKPSDYRKTHSTI